MSQKENENVPDVVSVQVTEKAFEALADLGAIAREYLGENEKRVANALHALLETLHGMLAGNDMISATSKRERAKTLREFERLTDWDANELVDELLVACLNSGQYERGLDVCDTAVRIGIRSDDDLLDDRPELLVRCGRTEEAEELLLAALDRWPDDPWSYIRLGDCSYTYVAQDEHRDFERAEDWYYRGYDRGLASQKTEGGRALIERLEGICIDRLRHESERQLLGTLEALQIGSWPTLVQLREQVRIAGDRCVLLAHLMDAIGHATVADRGSLDRANEHLQRLMDAYNLMPQERLDGLSPFEITVFEPKGPHELRLQDEMLRAFEEHCASDPSTPDGGALFSELFSDFQVSFMSQRDPVTGKRRSSIIDQERRQTKRKRDRDELPWMGFLEYRRK